MTVDWASFVLGLGVGCLVSTILVEFAVWKVRRHGR